MDGDRHGRAAPPGSLVALAERKALPAHQFMDTATVEWIASHRDEIPGPPSPPAARLGRVARRVAESAPIPPSWNAEPKLADGIHGTRHLLRTAALAALLAEERGLGEADTATLVIAAAVHDCRRIHDKDDIGHGDRAARWLTHRADKVFSRFGVDTTAERLRNAAIAVRLHEIPYSYFTEREGRERATAEEVTDLLKTADAMDRYRLPKRKWWPREEFLRVHPPAWLHRAAFDLVIESETTHLDGAGSADAVRAALETRGWL